MIFWKFSFRAVGSRVNKILENAPLDLALIFDGFQKSKVTYELLIKISNAIFAWKWLIFFLTSHSLTIFIKMAYFFYEQCLVSLQTFILICFKGTLECFELMHEKWLIFHQCMFQVIWILLIKWSHFKFNFNNKPWNLLFEFWNKNIAGNFSLSTW